MRPEVPSSTGHRDRLAFVRQITERLYPQGAVSEYATVQKLLGRLEAKQCVGRDRGGFAHVYRAAIDRRDVIDRRLGEVAAKLCGGSLTPLLMHLVEATQLTPADRQELRELLDETPAADSAPQERPQ